MPNEDKKEINDLSDCKSVGDHLTLYRKVIDDISSINNKLSDLKDVKTYLERFFMDEAFVAGVTGFSNDDVGVNVKEDLIATYDPHHWDDLVSWAVESGHEETITRGVKSKSLIELAVSGVPMPPFVHFLVKEKIGASRKGGTRKRRPSV